MANTITGRIYKINPTEQIPSKDGTKGFYKREIILDATRCDPWTGERSGFENFPSLEFTGDKCAELDHFQRGDVVTVTFDVMGIRYTRDNKESFFTKLRPYKIEVIKRAEHPARQMRAQPAQSVQSTYQGAPSYQEAPPYYPPQSEMPF